MVQRGTAGRAEVVVISDFQLGSLTAADIGALPLDIGLRFVAMDVPRPAGPFRALRKFHTGTASSLEHEIALDGPRTRVTMVPSGPPAGSVKILSAAEQGEGVASLKRIVAAAGAPELPVDRGLTMIFRGARLPDVGPLRAGWMVSAFAAASADDRLRSLASAHPGEQDRRLPSPWIPLAGMGLAIRSFLPPRRIRIWSRMYPRLRPSSSPRPRSGRCCLRSPNRRRGQRGKLNGSARLSWRHGRARRSPPPAAGGLNHQATHDGFGGSPLCFW